MTENAQKKAIVFVTLSYAPTIGGAEIQAQQLLERWAQTGHEVWVLTRRVRGSPGEETLKGVKVYRLWSLWLPILSWLTFSFSVLRFLIPRRDRIRSLWGIMLNVSTLAVVLSSYIFQRPAVVKISCSGEGGNLKMLHQSLVGGWLAVLLRLCHSVIVLNDETIDELKPYEIPPEKIKQIPNGVDTDLFHPAQPGQRRSLREKIGLQESDIGVLFVGRLIPQKNLENLLAIWPVIQTKCPEARLLIVGEGLSEESLKQSVKDHNIDKTVWFLGQRTDVADIYPACDLFVLPSFFEGLSNALLEAMASELPILLSRTAGRTNLIQTEKQGLLIDPDKREEWVEPLVRLLTDESLRHAFGKEARKVVQKTYSIESVFQAYDTLGHTLDTI